MAQYHGCEAAEQADREFKRRFSQKQDPAEIPTASVSVSDLSDRKIWLPKLLYDALPYLYLASGFMAFFATLYISAWFWVLPHYLLFSVACMHLGVLVYRRRHRRTDSDA